MKVPTAIWSTVSLRKVRINRGPNCDEARVRATMTIEKTTPKIVSIDAASIARSVRALSGPPAKSQAVRRLPAGPSVASIARVAADSTTAPMVMTAGTNQ